MDTNESEVRDLIRRRCEAAQAKDIDRLMSYYSPDIVYFDVVPPLRFTGTAEVRANFLRWFAGYEGLISLDTHDLTVAVHGDLAVASMLHLDSGTRKGGLQSAIWVRETSWYQRSNGAWLVTHEHISVPIDPASLRAWIPADKDQPA